MTSKKYKHLNCPMVRLTLYMAFIIDRKSIIFLFRPYIYICHLFLHSTFKNRFLINFQLTNLHLTVFFLIRFIWVSRPYRPLLNIFSIFNPFRQGFLFYFFSKNWTTMAVFDLIKNSFMGLDGVSKGRIRNILFLKKCFKIDYRNSFTNW